MLVRTTGTFPCSEDEPVTGTKWWKYLLWGLFILIVIPAIVFAAMWVRNKYFAGKGDYQPIGQ
jgi:hypothetical protein